MDKIKWIWFPIIYLVLIVASCKSVSTDINNDNEVNVANVTNDVNQLDFPQSWEGKYMGKLQIFKVGEQIPTQEIEMELVIEQVSLDSNRYEWKIIYGEDKIKGLREYELIVKDREKGIYAIDERNSILLDAFLVNGKLISRFSVAGNLITAIYQKNGDYIHFEILSGNEKANNQTGGKEGTASVGNYKITVSQSAKLKKVIQE